MSDRKLDQQVAEKVMGWYQETDYDYSPPQTDWYYEGDFKGHVNCDGQLEGLLLWRPSQDIRAAMEVVEKMRSAGWSFDIYIFPDFYSVSAFNAGTSDEITDEYLSNMRTRTESYNCASFAKALCLAALEASGVDAAELYDLNEGNTALQAINPTVKEQETK